MISFFARKKSRKKRRDFFSLSWWNKSHEIRRCETLMTPHFVVQQTAEIRSPVVVVGLSQIAPSPIAGRRFFLSKKNNNLTLLHFFLFYFLLVVRKSRPDPIYLTGLRSLFIFYTTTKSHYLLGRLSGF